jgi:hypothetical protein
MYATLFQLSSIFMLAWLAAYDVMKEHRKQQAASK